MNSSVCQKVGWVIACVLLLNAALFLYVRHEHTVYSWDYDCYYGICGGFEHYCMTSTHMKFVRDVMGSIRDQEYTAEPVVPAAVAIALGEKLHLFSFSRTAYIMANGNFYLVPALLLLIWFVSILKTNKFSLSFNAIQPAVWFAGALMALLTPALWLPLLRGYPDGGGLVFCFLVMALFVRWRQKQRSISGDTFNWLAIAVLLVGLVYFRRWYLYWILWFWISAGMLCLWDVFEQRRSGLHWSAIFKPRSRAGRRCHCVRRVDVCCLASVCSGAFFIQLRRPLCGLSDVKNPLAVSGKYFFIPGHCHSSCFSSGALLMAFRFRTFASW